ncbi:MAG: hypothetical protein ACR2LE_03530 [Nocardioidaceae bacterium]
MHRERQQVAARALDAAWSDGWHVFTNEHGEPVHPDTVSRLMTRFCFGRVRPYTSSLDRLGHTDPSITLRVYSHVLKEHAVGVADIFASAVSNGTPSSTPPEQETRS